MASKRIILLLMVIVWLERIQGRCYTPWGIRGHCVNIRNCNRLLLLLKHRPLRPSVLSVLRKAQCGFEGLDPKVCCEMGIEKEEIIEEKIETSDSMGSISLVKIDPEPTETVTTTAEPPVLTPVYVHPNRRLLDEDLCGPIAEGRIYGGNVTSINEFPWMALLGYDVGTRALEFRCGASIINKRYVLTAAHCTTGLSDDLKLVGVRVGEHDLSRERDCDIIENGIPFNCAAKYQDLGVERVHVHPEFARRRLQNDIALVRVRTDMNFGARSVRPICLPLEESASMNAEKVVVTGWGSTEFGTRSQRLLKVTLPIVKIEQCVRAYRHQTMKISYKQICAGGSNRMDSCSGDSGGPLQAIGTYDGKPRSTIYGIVSFGPHSCGLKGFPGVYTNVPYYVKWILDTLVE